MKVYAYVILRNGELEPSEYHSWMSYKQVESLLEGVGEILGHAYIGMQSIDERIKFSPMTIQIIEQAEG